MDNRTGIIMKTEKNIAYIMTATGEFAKVKIDKNIPTPTIGSEYCGEVVKNTFIKTSVLRYTSAACLAFTILLSGGGAYSYYKPVSTVTVSINPEIELKSNMWNRVISVNPLNSDGKKITDEISLKNKEIDSALVSILNQAKADSFIDDAYKESSKVITVNISGKELNLSSFENEIKKNALNVKVDKNGSTILNSSSNNNKDKLSGSENNAKSSESTNKPNKNSNNNKINNYNYTNKSSKEKNSTGENNYLNNNSKGNNGNVILNNSNKWKDDDYNKNSLKNNNSTKKSTNYENSKSDSKNKVNDLNKKNNNSNKVYKEEKKEEWKDKK